MWVIVHQKDGNIHIRLRLMWRNWQTRSAILWDITLVGSTPTINPWTLARIFTKTDLNSV